MKTQYTVLFLLMVIFSGCNPTPLESTSILEQRLDSIQKTLDSVLHRLPKDSSFLKLPTDTTSIQPIPLLSTKKVVEKKQPLLPKKRLEKIEPKKTERTEELYYFTGTKNPSIRFSPWVEGRRTITLYHPDGSISYTLEDAQLSYSSISRVTRFHPNGAVETLHIDLNPGASMYMYDTDITFDVQNDPLWKRDSQWPSSLEDQMKAPEYWDRRERRWKKQEIVLEQPVPIPLTDSVKKF
ncbi:MAG: hypothetical protein MUE33_04475 [Cytophagaceae bacterium]|jgi:hypothetical protein|nr:hypothetical protein [Cytophagaceae bacterium]